MKHFILGVLTTAAFAASAYYVSNIDYQAIGLLITNNAIGLLYDAEYYLNAS